MTKPNPQEPGSAKPASGRDEALKALGDSWWREQCRRVAALKDHPDNGKAGVWVVEDDRHRAEIVTDNASDAWAKAEPLHSWWAWDVTYQGPVAAADTEIAALARKLEEARAALEFYANKKNYSETVRTSKTFSLLISPVGDDEGDIARRALAQMEQG